MVVMVIISVLIGLAVLSTGFASTSRSWTARPSGLAGLIGVLTGRGRAGQPRVRPAPGARCLSGAALRRSEGALVAGGARQPPPCRSGRS
ncbi:hypothetical protein P4054_29090 [Pseudomonas aeruginosa]|nr:hypothetical protein [Pseudomonas aeruginosa]